jgi:DNA-directed RNA polymerase specialized sigma24 family protein
MWVAWMIYLSLFFPASSLEVTKQTHKVQSHAAVKTLDKRAQAPKVQPKPEVKTSLPTQKKTIEMDHNNLGVSPIKLNEALHYNMEEEQRGLHKGDDTLKQLLGNLQSDFNTARHEVELKKLESLRAAKAAEHAAVKVKKLENMIKDAKQAIRSTEMIAASMRDNREYFSMAGMVDKVTDLTSPTEVEEPTLNLASKTDSPILKAPKLSKPEGASAKPEYIPPGASDDEDPEDWQSGPAAATFDAPLSETTAAKDEISEMQVGNKADLATGLTKKSAKVATMGKVTKNSKPFHPKRI